MPKLKYLISASVMLEGTTSQSPTTRSDVIATVGQPLGARLNIRYTRRWDSAAGQASDHEDERVDFAYEISAPPDRWLISGLKRGHFAAEADEDVEFDLVLVPLVTGQILLPRVEVHLAAKPRGRDGHLERSSDQSGPPPVVVVPCETDYLSQAVTVVVVAGVESTTVGIGGHDGIAGSSRLMHVTSPVD